MVWNEHRHRRPQAGSSRAAAGPRRASPNHRRHSASDHRLESRGASSLYESRGARVHRAVLGGGSSRGLSRAHLSSRGPREAARSTAERTVEACSVQPRTARPRKRRQVPLVSHLLQPAIDADGSIVRWYATGTDIDDRKRSEDRLRNETLALREDIVRSSMFDEIVGSSEVLRRVLSQVSKVSPTDSTVLILGETGTGKELIAHAIHDRSKRSAGAFIRVNGMSDQ